jgi:ABC-type spermidine/putrescine transport system permease subunit II
VAKQPSTQAYDFSLKSAGARATRNAAALGAALHFDVVTCVMIAVLLVTGYLVLPPLYSVVQTSLFTTRLTGEIDQFTLQYYRNLLTELRVLGPLLNPLYSSLGASL